MKKILTAVVATALLAINSIASEEMHLEGHESEDNFYIATKAMYTLGATVEEETSTLDGGTGAGLGIDVGYKLGAGVSVEIDGTYVKGSVVETKANGDKESMDASYMTSSLDVAYVYHATHEVELFAKGGYEYEFEKISKLGVDAVNSGFIYAVGTEYELSHTSALSFEYEVTTIKGPRGNSVFAGYVYSF